MKIDHIETIHLYFEYSEGKSFSTPAGPVKGRMTTLVRVYADNGLTGIGSAYAHPAMVEAAIQHLAPLLEGRAVTDTEYDPLSQFMRGDTQIERLWRGMYVWTRWSGRKGAAMAALGGIDQALWDLTGQAEDKPVWKLLGGKTSKCPAYASGMLYGFTPAETAELAAKYVSRGFRRVKMRIGYSWEHDVAAVRAVRAAIGDKIDLMCDGTWRFDLEGARRMAKELVANRVFWFEEPFEADDLDNYVALRGTIGLPLASGENEFGFEGFRELIRIGAVDIVQPDASRCGGISEVVKVARLARTANLRFAPHSWCDPVAVISNAHVVAAHDNGITVEIDQTGNRFIEELLGHPLTVKDGLLDLGDRPGLGTELDPAALERFRVASPADIPQGNHCDIILGPPTVLAPIPPYVGDRSQSA
ncbi:MAG: mandelate racemase/muconate lactonizing enzyme family protein [Candidatus Abyssobacteria bacterium SURF_5]|uniref:Mandelate racemase/muconate lactonizing enzyme family protein n=1 Tax=Abyssobacteria bacterium (strain SURF_5) TaxID=2093360 RepID=A0A3A4P847_ABYX5|nr:MAG: mandelate racemase/muconate lactonizing enzyme family protein [Candidatus Abyssubacteria bacterium SURF_5]